MKNLILIPGVLFWSFCFAQARNDNPMETKLDSVINKAANLYLNKPGRMGISIGFTGAKGTKRYNYGKTAPNSNELPSSNSVYEIGSITKTFTALLVAKAVVEGRIGLNDDIRKHLPGSFPNLKYPNGQTVKVGYLLSHTAQFPINFITDSLSGPLTEETFIKHLQALKLDTLKSPRYVYSNTGYLVLAYALENLYKLSYVSLIENFITKPLKMNDTRVSYLDTKQNTLLKGYNQLGQEAPAVSHSFPAAGGLHSTLNDMIKYTAYQLAEIDEAVKLTHRLIYGCIDQDAVGFMWSIGKTRNWDYYIRTDGGTNGFRSFCSLYPNDRVGIILLTNQTDNDAGGDLYQLTATILSELKK